jgi:monofunctional biosynthetic peptidoglycan transglycosylase
LVPALQVALVAFWNPPTTMPLVLHSAQKGRDGQAAANTHYRWKSLDEISPEAVLVLLAAEDMDFFTHRGFDWPQIRLSVIQLLAGHRKPSGASTITQQSARSLFLWQGRSWVRKALEAYYTVWMEFLLDKRRILELYANVIEVAEGIYGLEAGAQHYYAKSASELSRPEAIALASLLPAPRHRNPLHPNAAVILRQSVLRERMERLSPTLLRELRFIGVSLPPTSGAEQALTSP